MKDKKEPELVWHPAIMRMNGEPVKPTKVKQCYANLKPSFFRKWIKPLQKRFGDCEVFESLVDYRFIKKGDRITLHKDDGDNFPHFWNKDKSKYCCMHISEIKPCPEYKQGDKVLVSYDGDMWEEQFYFYLADKISLGKFKSESRHVTLNQYGVTVSTQYVKPYIEKEKYTILGKEYELFTDQVNGLHELIEQQINEVSK